MSDIAIVGLDGRFPGAPGPQAFWELLMSGADAIDEVPADRWDKSAFHDPQGAAGRTNTTSGGFIADADAFDHEFFGISPREAEAMDPQQRLLLQTGWRAFEDAGLDPRRQAGTRTGVFVGVMGSEWAQLHMTDYDRVTPHLGSGNGYCMIANRLSYLLDLKGPSWAVDSACSSSLVALHQACVALRGQECDQALVGGVNVILTPALHIFYSQAGLSAPDAACKPFSRDANGIVRGEAVGAVILRRLEDAVADGLPVYAVIKGSAVNQDGRSNGLTAPSRWAQQEVIAEAYRRAGVRPQDIAAVEAHGTGTVLGDMIEANALGAVHSVERDQPCSIGSVKGNIGHTEGAAGIAAVIKVALALDRGVLPPSRHARTENRLLKLRDKGLRLLKAPLRLAGDKVAVSISSFGLGGTNAHVVLAHPSAAVAPEEPGSGVLTVSGNGPEALARNAAQLAQDLQAAPERRLGQLCWTSNQVKSSGQYRLALAVSTKNEAVAALRQFAAGSMPESVRTGSRRAVSLGWLFTGQGSQYPGMTSALHTRYGSYRRALAEVDEAMAAHLGGSIAQHMLGTASEIDDTGLAQPAIFAAGYALGRVLGESGAEPEWMLGHSVGEFAPAVLAGALGLEDACRLVATRARLMQQLPADGGMLAARCSAESVSRLLAEEPSVSLASINGPDDVVCAGPLDALERITERLASAGIATRRLQVSHAFHSPMMEPVLAEFAAVASEITYHPLRRTVYSTLHGRRLGADELMDADYWTQHISRPVRFSEAVADALRQGATHLMEIGPRQVLGPLLRRTPVARGIPVLAPCPGPQATGGELADAIARLHCDGLEPDWAPLYEPAQRTVRRLTPYTFSTAARFWTSAPVRPDGPSRMEFLATRNAPGAPGIFPAEPEPLHADAPIGDAFEQDVFGIIADVCGYAAHEIRAGSLLHEELGFDSIMLIQLKDRLEQRWSHPIQAAELLPELTTAGDVTRFLRSRTATDALLTR
ncbi:type I polyketide synthase [Streptomyces rimosus]|uniref:type I polyketide synthase n=1 Tax=Streptomyces rimosus TaxID=1927 RepID=UPI0004C7FD5F|nr:type I polyketide synthase [Streptomyces rimosus]